MWQWYKSFISNRFGERTTARSSWLSEITCRLGFSDKFQNAKWESLESFGRCHKQKNREKNPACFVAEQTAGPQPPGKENLRKIYKSQGMIFFALNLRAGVFSSTDNQQEGVRRIALQSYSRKEFAKDLQITRNDFLCTQSPCWCVFINGQPAGRSSTNCIAELFKKRICERFTPQDRWTSLTRRRCWL